MATTTRPPDLGLIYTLAGTGLTTSYQFSDNQPIGGASFARFTLYITGKAATGVTGVTVKLQGIYANPDAVVSDTIDPQDLISYKDNTNTSQPELEHVYTPTAATTDYYSFHVDPRCYAGGVRVGVKIAGTGATGDSIRLFCVAW